MAKNVKKWQLPKGPCELNHKRYPYTGALKATQGKKYTSKMRYKQQNAVSKNRCLEGPVCNFIGLLTYEDVVGNVELGDHMALVLDVTSADHDGVFDDYSLVKI